MGYPLTKPLPIGVGHAKREVRVARKRFFQFRRVDVPETSYDAEMQVSTVNDIGRIIINWAKPKFFER